jgi:hypothetical protein
MTHRTLLASFIPLVMAIALGTGCRVKQPLSATAGAGDDLEQSDFRSYEDYIDARNCALNQETWEQSDLPVCDEIYRKGYDYTQNPITSIRKMKRLKPSRSAVAKNVPVDDVISIFRAKDFTWELDYARAADRLGTSSKTQLIDGLRAIARFIVRDNTLNDKIKFEIARTVITLQYPEFRRVTCSENFADDYARFYYLFVGPQILGCKFDVHGGKTNRSLNDDPFATGYNEEDVRYFKENMLTKVPIWYDDTVEGIVQKELQKLR